MNILKHGIDKKIHTKKKKNFKLKKNIYRNFQCISLVIFSFDDALNLFIF
jgi:hypothetical protein